MGAEVGVAERGLLYQRLLPGGEAAYDSIHRFVWPEIRASLISAGLRNISGFRRGTDVWYYAEAADDLAGCWAAYDARPAAIEWDRDLRTVVAESLTGEGEPIWYTEIFHLPGGHLTVDPTRALVTLIIDPEFGGAYDAEYAAVWEEMQEAMRAAGAYTSTGFRRGAHVVFYGEYDAPVEEVHKRLSSYEIAAKWGSRMEQSVATMFDDHGRLITADLVFHQS